MLRRMLHKAKGVYMKRLGWHTDKHIVVIESDDWGSIRMPSKDVFLKLQALGDTPEKDGFLANDSLESATDLENLFAVLDSVRDSQNKPAIITANFAMRNPKFECIDIERGKYVSECFTETYERYYHDGGHTLDVLYKGIASGFFVPQLHCREHLNVDRWMSALREGRKDAITAFQHEMIGIFASFSPENQFGYMDELNMDSRSQIDDMRTVLSEAMQYFETIFGYRSKTFVASCFVWNRDIENILHQCGVRGIQSGRLWQLVSTYSKGTRKLKRALHYCGQRNANRQIYLVRNCEFEPAYSHNPQKCMETAYDQVVCAFENRKPAVINSHRFNYISAVNSENAKENLLALKELLEKIVRTYPDVVFMSSDQLLTYIESKH